MNGKISGTDATDAVSIQMRLRDSKTWKEYKALHAEIAKVAAIRPQRDARDLFKPVDAKTKARISKLGIQADGLDAPLRDLFHADSALSADLAALLKDGISNTEEMHRSKPGRRPKPDFAAEAGRGFLSIQRNFRIVKAFNRLGLQDSLIGPIRDSLPKAISNQRRAMQILIRKDTVPMRPAGHTDLSTAQIKPKESLDPGKMEAELVRMEIRLNAWYDEEVGLGSRRPRKSPDQAALDHSETWLRYADLHRTLSTEKSDSGLARILSSIRQIKPALDIVFQDDSLAVDLTAWPEALVRTKQGALGPKVKPIPDSLVWTVIWETYESLKIRFRITKAFRAKELAHPLIGTMASRLPTEIRNLKGELKLRESDGRPAHAKQSAEIKAFVKASEAEFAAWKKKPR
ncbi:MAG: hypothetical protein M3Y08_16090 [Fibrobacterota bacterium]|nr:hypothetical protein [Fibrobacterota bacterium]